MKKRYTKLEDQILVILSNFYEGKIPLDEAIDKLNRRCHHEWLWGFTLGISVGLIAIFILLANT